MRKDCCKQGADFLNGTLPQLPDEFQLLKVEGDQHVLYLILQHLAQGFGIQHAWKQDATQAVGATRRSNSEAPLAYIAYMRNDCKYHRLSLHVAFFTPQALARQSEKPSAMERKKGLGFRNQAPSCTHERCAHPP